jgi:hypothetical protein
MSIARSALIRGPGYVTWNSASFFTQADINVRHAPVWEKVPTTNFGRVDDWKKDLVIKIPLKLWGAYENLGVLFPAGLLTPVPGTSIFGASDLPLVILGRNGDQITYANAQLTKMSNLYLGVDADLFAAEVEFTALLANSTAPESSGSYFTVATGQTYADATAAFAKANYKRARCTAAWGSVTGFTSIVPQKGFALDWSLDLKPMMVDGYGTVDMTIGEDTLIANVKCIPIGPTLAQLKSNSKVEAVMGALGSGNSADFTITGSGLSIVLKNAFMVDNGLVFGVEPLRAGEVTWRTTTGFSSGSPAAIATVG